MDKAPTPEVAYNTNLVLHHNHDVETAVDGYIEVKYEKVLTEEEMTALRHISLVNSKMPAIQNAMNLEFALVTVGSGHELSCRACALYKL
jgi:hypothetical protein